MAYLIGWSLSLHGRFSLKIKNRQLNIIRTVWFLNKCTCIPLTTYPNSVIPSSPKNVQVIFVNRSALELKWQPPAVTGDQTHLFYDVDCRKPCESEDENKCVDKACGSDVFFIPRKDGFNITHVIVGNLTSYVNYTMKIYAKNRVSEVAKMKHRIEASLSEITVRTDASGKSWSAP